MVVDKEADLQGGCNTLQALTNPKPHGGLKMDTPSLPQLNKANLAVHHAATREESRYALNCVLVNGVGTVATDGRC